MNLLGIDIPMPVIIIFVLIFVWLATRKRKLSYLKKEDTRLGYQLSIAKKKRELKELEGKSK